MSGESRRSTLQIEILGYLRTQEAPAVTTLAAALEKSRPAISRSLHILLEQGLVERDGRVWRITEAGRTAAEQALTQLSASTEDMIERAGNQLSVAYRLAEEGLLDPMNNNFLGVAGAVLDGSLARSAIGILGEDVVNTAWFGIAMNNDVVSDTLRALSGIDPTQITIADAISDPGLSNAISGLIGTEALTDAVLGGPHLLNTMAHEIAGMSDPEAMKVLSAGAAYGVGEDWPGIAHLVGSEALISNPFFAEAQSAANTLMGTLSADHVQSLEHLVGLGTSAVTNMSLGLFDLGENLAITSPVDFVSMIPGLEEHFADLERASEGADALDQGGLGYSRDLWTIEFLIQLSEVEEESRGNWINEKVSEATRSEEYFEVLADLFDASPILQARWGAVQSGIEDHRNERYYSSIAVMLPQIEGLINDILLSKGLVRLKSTKVMKVATDGSANHSLGSLEAKGKVALDASLLETALATQITNFLARDRNGILHGVNPSYGSPELSTQCVVTLTALAKTIAELEINSVEQNTPVA